MAERRLELKTRTIWLLAGILVLALGLRVIFALRFPSFSPDGSEYEILGKNLLLGNGFSESVAPPYVPAVIRDSLYPALVAAIYAVAGQSHLVVYLVQAILSTLTIYFLFLIAVWFFDERVGLVTALLAALYLPVIVYVADILTETTYIFLIVLGTYCFVRAKMQLGKWLIAAGVVFGLAALTRSDGLLYPIALVVYALIVAPDKVKMLRTAVVFGLVMGVIISPWAVRNYLLVGRPLLRDSSMTMAALAIGTGRSFSDPGYSMPFHYPGGMPPEVRQAHEKMVIENYLADVRNNPRGYLVTRVTQLTRMWMYGSQGLPVAEADIGDLAAQGNWGQFGLRLGIFFVFGPLVLLLALSGAVIAIRRNGAVSILLVYGIAITLLCLPLYADFRYGLSGQLFLLTFAGVALLTVADRWQAWRVKGQVHAR